MEIERNNFSEKTRVQIPALIHLRRLGYIFRPKKNLNWDKDTNILLDVFKESIKRINKNATQSNIENLFEEIKALLKNDDLGEAFFNRLQKRDGIRLIDFFDVEKNDFSCTYEMPFESEGNVFKPDITIYVNGLPLAFIEVKVPNNKGGIEEERKRMDKRLSNSSFRKFFNEIQLLIFSNNMEYEQNNNNNMFVPISGSFYSTVQRDKFRFSPFREEDLDLIESVSQKEIDKETEEEVLKEANAQTVKWTPEYTINLDGKRPTNRIITSLLFKKRFIYLLNYGFCYVREKDDKTGAIKVTKHVMRYPQLLGSLELIKKLDQGLRKGIFWHTQGSGKTELSFYLVKILSDYFYRKKEINARFLFIPDRIDLLNQARDAFIIRGLSAKTVDNREKFVESIKKHSSKSGYNGELEITVLNTQKLSEEAKIIPNHHYSTCNQTIIFVDECHRSYDLNGTFLSNLINIDKKSIIIGLTGTPIIIGKDEEKSKALFGNYIHKYFYNQSIADGYTLRLMREEVIKTFCSKLQDVKHQLIQKGINLDDIYCYPTYVEEIVNYITKDFEIFQKIHEKVGAMIVCYSNHQAQLIYDSLRKHEKKAELIIYTVPKVNDIIDRYKKTNEIDYLVVNHMLLTGFDCARLKKLYLLKKIHEHNLLQGLTRVNRPFENCQYGFIVDFEDIMGEFNKTNEAYMKELNDLYGDDVIKEIQIFVDKQEIFQKAKEIDSELFKFETNNMEEFVNQINTISSKKLKELKKILNEAKELYNSVKSFDNVKFHKLGINKIISMIKEVNQRYDSVIFQELLKNNDGENSALILGALADIDFKFINGQKHELLLADKLRETINRLKSNFENNVDKKDQSYVLLSEELKRILSEHNFYEISKHNFHEINEEVLKKLESLANKIFNLNTENSMLAKKYDNDCKFVRIHKRFKEKFEMMGETKIYSILSEIKKHFDGIILENGALLNNQPYLEKEIKSKVCFTFKKYDNKLTSEKLLNNIDRMIFSEYYNEFKGTGA